MKANTRKLLNEQIKIILKELEQVEDIADRVELRIEAIQAIYNISCHDVEDIIPQGKESIKEDKAKKQVVMEESEEEEDAEVIVDEEPEEEYVEPEEEELEEVSMDDIVNAGANLEPEVAANQAVELEQEEIQMEEPSSVIVADENGNEVDVTEEYSVLNPEISDDFRKEYALQIKEYGTLETYKTLNFIEETEDEIIGYKNLVAYWIDTCELETMEYYINYFASNIEIDEETGEETYVGEELHIDFLNSNNVKGFTEYVESILEEQE